MTPTGRTLRALLEEMIARGASDLHLTAGSRPLLRIDGALRPVRQGVVLGPTETEQLAGALLTSAQQERFAREDELDCAFGIPQLARFRVNCFRQRGGVALVFRQIPHQIQSLQQLGLPPVIARFAERPRGLVLVTGPTGSGKSTTLAAMLDKINRERQGHILTVEDPIEFVHAHQGCLVNQREIGADTRSFARALKYALREDPDVVLIGEMRDHETIAAGLTIAETGHLVLATLHTNGAAEAIHRIIDVFPSHQQSQVRTQLASVLEGVVTQALLPRASGAGRVAAAEVLVVTPAIRALIRDDKVHQIQSMMQSGRKFGMQTMTDALAQLVQAGLVSATEALRVAGDPDELQRLIGRGG